MDRKRRGLAKTPIAMASYHCDKEVPFLEIRDLIILNFSLPSIVPHHHDHPSPS